ncbi:hypothetical protein FNF28_07052 [Cafeteria roenbergensis]|uniref:Uncharacterized protein n=1 Tax=Cafeteria roenbergensis TaxID=33653 RepID=A0A5A8CJK0_CAFRO|nr:hypothetical protein FNF28_07052 [Cafeteria roenbergensis]
MNSPPAGLAWLFYVYFGVMVVAVGLSIGLASYHPSMPGFVLVPALLALFAFDNIAVALTLEASTWASLAGLLAARYALQSLSVPLQLLAGFELAYVIRKKRSSNFCCMTFDQGHRKKEGACSSLLRYSVWFLAFVLVFVSTVANAEYILDPSSEAYTHTSRFSSKSAAFSPPGGRAFSLSRVVDIVPEALSICFMLVIGVSLWRYGSAQSMDVSATACNRWAVLVVAVVGLLLAWVLQPKEWVAPYAYNGCACAVGLALVFTCRLIHRNLLELQLLKDTIEHDNTDAAAAEPEALPPRFRTGSKDGTGGSARNLDLPGRVDTPGERNGLRSAKSMPAMADRHGGFAPSGVWGGHGHDAVQLPPPDAKFTVVAHQHPHPPAPLHHHLQHQHQHRHQEYERGAAAAGRDHVSPALRRPLPPGPRPPDAFQGVNPMLVGAQRQGHLWRGSDDG